MQPGEIADGLGLAETTPGPLIMVTQFVADLAVYHAPEPFKPIVAGLLGAGLTTWGTFAPSFLWIFALAPWIDRLGYAVRLKSVPLVLRADRQVDHDFVGAIGIAQRAKLCRHLLGSAPDQSAFVACARRDLLGGPLVAGCRLERWHAVERGGAFGMGGPEVESIGIGRQGSPTITSVAAVGPGS